MLLLHRGSRSDGLAAGLARLLATPAGDPFAPEVVAVPTRGVERWLTQTLSATLGARAGRSDGVCANVEFPFPHTLVDLALAAAEGRPAGEDPWAPQRSVWPLLDVVGESLGEPWLAPLAAHLGRTPHPHPGETRDGPPQGPAAVDDDRQDRRFAAVRALAGRFARCGVERPQLLVGWVEGRMPPEGSDGAWQAELWLRLRRRIGVEAPAERLGAACARLVADPSLVDLPPRVSLFGLTRLPTGHREVLAALAAHRDLHLWLLHPSPALWERQGAVAVALGPRGSHPLVAARNPLLRTWGRDARELQVALTLPAAPGRPGVGRDAGVVGEPPPTTTLLGRIQADVRADREPPGTMSTFPTSSSSSVVAGAGPDDPRPPLAAADRSLQVHACHGRARQVEVLRDAIAHHLADDETLQARDVIVLCPDIEAFAPLVHATFGPGAEVAGADLHVRLADRSLRRTNPVLDAVARLLEMAGGRVGASEVLDLAGTAPLRARFGFDDDELSRLDGWVRSAGVRWGIDRAWRDRYRLGNIDDGTWSAGLDRIVTGVAMTEEAGALVGGVLPLDDVDSGDIDLVGRAAEMLERLDRVLRSFSSAHSLPAWLAAIGTAADLLVGTAPGQEWQRRQLGLILDEVASEAGAASATLRPAEVRTLLADRLAAAPGRANFRTGHVTVCTLVPMRSVPHRVVCLLGIDDGVFPRRSTPDADDLLSADPWIGDRDPRSEDRQLLLDAVMAAGDAVVVVCSGRDERTNAVVPPAVPVGELLDAVDRTVRVDDGPARRHVVVEHPLQPFDERCVTPAALRRSTAWSFDPMVLAGAYAARSGRTAPPVVPALLPEVALEVVALDDLLAFVRRPVGAFLRQRLGAAVPFEEQEHCDSLPVTLDALEHWHVADRVLRARLAGRSIAEITQAEVARGGLPPGALGTGVLDEMWPEVEGLVARAAALTADAGAASTGEGGPARPGSGRQVEVFAVGGRTTVVGTVSDVHGQRVVSVGYSRLPATLRLCAWVRVVALTATDPTRAWCEHIVARPPYGSKGGAAPAVVTIGPLADDAAARGVAAARHLEVLVDLYGRGMRGPLPLAPRTSLAWAEAVRAEQPPEDAARKRWATSADAFVPCEDLAAEHVQVYGRQLPWKDLLAEVPCEGEEGPGWGKHPSRLGRLSWRLWADLLATEVHR